jgi:hypothetical protein
MAYEHKPGQGTLGKAKNKTKDTSPDLTGKIKLMDGQEYWISAWVKKSSNGGEFYSLALGQPVQPAQEVYSAAHQSLCEPPRPVRRAGLMTLTAISPSDGQDSRAWLTRCQA